MDPPSPASRRARPVQWALVFAGSLMLLAFLLALPLLAAGLPSWVKPAWCQLEAILLALAGTFLLLQEIVLRSRSVHARAIVVFAGLILVAKFAPWLFQVIITSGAAWNEIAFFNLGNAFETFGWLTADSSLPVVWGSALARIASPEDGRAARAGRLAGGLLLFAVVLSLAGRGFFWIAVLGKSVSIAYGSGVFGILAGILDFCIMALVVWAGVESVRGAPAPEAGARRMRRIHRLMIFWLAAGAAHAVTMALIPGAMGAGTGTTWYFAWQWAGYAAVCVSLAVAVKDLLRPPAPLDLKAANP